MTAVLCVLVFIGCLWFGALAVEVCCTLMREPARPDFQTTSDLPEIDPNQAAWEIQQQRPQS